MCRTTSWYHKGLVFAIFQGMERRFTRTIEDFTCGTCGFEVKGNGYTNHCPRCLWSRHVDKNPGDRAEECGGMMEPIRAEKEGERLVLTHRCARCGFERRNTLQREDDFDVFLKVMRSPRPGTGQV